MSLLIPGQYTLALALSWDLVSSVYFLKDVLLHRLWNDDSVTLSDHSIINRQFIPA